jgi:IS1 family transposase
LNHGKRTQHGEESGGYYRPGRGLLCSLHVAHDWRGKEHDPAVARRGRYGLRRIQNVTLRNIPAQRVQVDEIWSFCYSKEKNATQEMWKRVGYAGDVWTFAAIDADTKLVISWAMGRRDAGCAADFLQDVAGRLANRIQLTTDGHRMYLTAVPDAFGNDFYYAQLVKVFGNDPEGQTRYSPAQCLGTQRVEVIGNPDQDHISTSYIERQNLTMRMQMRRFTRLTNAFSKKIDNHMHQVALFYMWYNFSRVHQTLRVTPAMAAGLSSHVWSIQDIVALAALPKNLAA